MAENEFKLPDLGENVESGEVISVLVSMGDTLNEDQPVIELETDKAVIEVPSSVSGKITQVFVKEGDTASVGQIILTVENTESEESDSTHQELMAKKEPDAASTSDSTTFSNSTEDSAAGSIEVNLPELGEGISNGEIVGIMTSVGDEIAIDDPVLEIEIDKGVIEMPSPVTGTVIALYVKNGDKASVGQLILSVASDASVSTVTPTPNTESAPLKTTPSPTPRATDDPIQVVNTPNYTDTPAPKKLIPAAPSVRRLAREIGIDITQVKGNGPGGRISADDVKAHSRLLNVQRATPSVTNSGVAMAAAPLPDFSRWGKTEREPMSNIRRVTAQHMTQAWSTIPHVTQFDKADITDLEVWRKQYGKVTEAAGGKLTPTAIILKVAAAALVKYPNFNASIDIENEEIVYKKFINIGVAVDTKRGLLVPVIRDVVQKNIVELAVELTEIAEKARSGKLGIEDMQGGTFTISNIGGIGGTAFTPIVNSPEVAILGVARGNHEPVWNDSAFVPRIMMPLSLSYDHRLIDGANGARFLRWLCNALENPFVMALEG